MIQDTELTELMQNIATKMLYLWNKFQNAPVKTSFYFQHIMHLWQEVVSAIGFIFNPSEKILPMQLSYWQEASLLTQKQLASWLQGKSELIEDKRFNSSEWVQNPFFNLLSQHYLLARKHFTTLLNHLENKDKKLLKKIKFFTERYLDALSPTNFLHTNPQLIAETIQSQGKNLLRGLKNLLTDLESDSSYLLIKMTDTEAFHVGKNIAITQGKVIYRTDLMELIQYKPTTEKVKAIPLLIIPPWINKYYILDLSPSNSLVSWLLKQGITVFMISWINPNSSHAKKGLYDYLKEGPLTAIDIIQQQLKVRQVNTLGFCIGGTLLACLLAYLKASHNSSVRSATFLASLIDFSDPGDISVFIDEKQIGRIEEEMKSKGYLEGRFMTNTFNLLRANDLIWSFFIKNYLQGQNPLPFDILFWNADATNMPAQMHSQYLRWMYLQNKLIKGKISFNHKSLDIKAIDVPTFFISTQKDHIAPWKTTYLGFKAMKGSKRFLLGESGHISGIINPPGSNKYGFYRCSENAQTAEEWLVQAKYQKGSWWPEWTEWLLGESGEWIKAPHYAQLPWKPLLDAPGSYVFSGC